MPKKRAAVRQFAKGIEIVVQIHLGNRRGKVLLETVAEDLKVETAVTAADTGSNPNRKQKFDVAVDIESIRDWLAKEWPEKTILGHLWRGIEHMTKLAGMVEATDKVWPCINPFL